MNTPTFRLDSMFPELVFCVDSIATHDYPAWRAQANYLIMADLSPWGLQDRWEQLWASQVAEDEFILCCIPFFTYGMALGDRATAPLDPDRPAGASEGWR
jgi:hypothetical protein